MNILDTLNDKSIRPSEKRAYIINTVKSKRMSLKDLQEQCSGFNDKQTGIILEAIEEITRKHPEQADDSCLYFAQEYIISKSNNLKRESSRIVGNLAHRFPDKLVTAINYLLANATDDASIVRWSSAYALARIIILPQFANTSLYQTLTDLAKRERENGVKIQYLEALKKAAELRGRSEGQNE